MNIVVNDKVIAIKPLGRLNALGNTYEVANIQNNMIVLRDINTKVAMCSVEMAAFDKYFKKVDEFKEWTEWCPLASREGDGNIVGYYKTNNRKVMVKLHNGVKAIATCNCKHGDTFNLAIGIQLAYMRCVSKTLKKGIDEYQNVIKHLEYELNENNEKIDKVIKRMELNIPNSFY